MLFHGWEKQLQIPWDNSAIRKQLTRLQEILRGKTFLNSTQKMCPRRKFGSVMSTMMKPGTNVA